MVVTTEHKPHSELDEALRVARAWAVEEKPEDIADVFLVSRALLGLYEHVEAAQKALRAIAAKQQECLHIIETHGFVFDSIGKEPGNWQHLAFTLYTEICEVDVWARHALGIELGEDASNPASGPQNTANREDRASE